MLLIRTLPLLLALASPLIAPLAHAQASPGNDHSAHHAPSAPAAPAAPAELTPSEGEITRIDARAGKLTLRHGPITHLSMPPMTMVFRLQDPAQLAGLQVGQRLRFWAEDQGGALVITRLEAL